MRKPRYWTVNRWRGKESGKESLPVFPSEGSGTRNGRGAEVKALDAAGGEKDGRWHLQQKYRRAFDNCEKKSGKGK